MAAKTLFARDIEPNMSVDTPFLVRNVERKMTRQEKPYLDVTLADKTGVVSGRVWSDNLPFIEGVLVPDAVVNVTGATQVYGERLSLIITDATAVDDADLSEYLATSPRDRGQMREEFIGLAATIADRDLHALLQTFIDSPEFDDFCRAPAADIEAYAYLGGLLEHTLSVAQMSLAIATMRMDIDADLLLAAALLHDTGKVDAYNPVTFAPTDDGLLLDHTTLTLIRVDRFMDLAGGLPEATRRRLYHAVATHQSRGFNGAQPQTKEAVVLQACNQLDITLSAASLATAGDGPWTETIRSLRRRFYRGDTTAAERGAGAPAPTAVGQEEQARSIWDEPVADDSDMEIPF